MQKGFLFEGEKALPFKAISPQCIHLYIKVTPKASKARLGEIQADASFQNQFLLKVYVTAPPEDGKANKAVIELLSKKFHIAKSLFTLVSGHTDRIKVIKIEAPEHDIHTIKTFFS